MKKPDRNNTVYENLLLFGETTANLTNNYQLSLVFKVVLYIKFNFQLNK